MSQYKVGKPKDLTEAVSLLKKFYPGLKSLSEMSCTRDNGDGSQSIVFDIIDLKSNTLHKVSDYYSDSGYWINDDWDEFDDDCPYRDASERCSTFDGTEPTAIEVDRVIETIIVEIINAAA